MSDPVQAVQVAFNLGFDSGAEAILSAMVETDMIDVGAAVVLQAGLIVRAAVHDRPDLR